MDRNEQISTAKNSAALKRILKWMLLVLQGAIIGAGAILPGVSGGVLCVVFGIYQPMMALLAHPLRAFKKYVGLLLPVLIGWVYVPTDFDTKEKALSGAKAAEKGLK